MRRPILWIVDPSIAWPEHEGVEAISADWPGDRRVFRPALDGDGPTPGAGYAADAVVVMGSRASVNDADRPWLRDLALWLDPIVRGEVMRPLLGICFGHQLVASRAGARVGKIHDDGREERGIQESRFAPSRLVPDGGTLHVVASHGEEVKDVPSGFRVTASRDRVRCDAFEHERLPVMSVQFHPEARASFLRLREMPSDPREPRAFADQARLLERFRESARALS